MKHKHKKTRKEKIVADYRHQVYTFENKEIFSSTNSITTGIKSNNVSYSYSYVLHDISKTGILTLLIIAVQIALFFLLKNHIILIPNLNY